MGLDITAYRQLSYVRPLTPDEVNETEADDDSLVTLWHFNYDFPAHSEDLKEESAYTAADEFGFRAGSYFGYNKWRDELAKLVGHPSAKHAWANGADGKPFFELIHFSDCEGIIGPKTSAKLAADFAVCQPMVDTMAGEDSKWFKDKYADWRKAFEMAADNGAVEFH